MIEKSSNDILVPQKHFNMTFFSFWIMLITTVQWTMLDMYLPALPILTRTFHVSEALLNVSLNAGILMTAAGTLISGILSDRYGRKGILIIGFILNIVASFACAAAGGVGTLILMRSMQGLGTGFVLTVTTAIIKDSLSGRRFQNTMTILQSIAATGPVFAPAIGACLINMFSWRAIFIFLGGASLATLIPMLFSTETWPKEGRHHAELGRVLADAAGMLKNKGFMLFLAIMSFLTLPVWAYIAVSSYIYIDEFGVGNVVYGAYYSTGAIMSCLAPFVYMLLARVVKTRRIVSISIGLTMLGGGILLTGGKLSPILFMVGVLPLMISEGVIRPLGYVVLLEAFSEAAGTTSSWVHFLLNVVGVVGTSLATLPWPSMITGVWIIALGCAAISILCWIIILKQKLLYSSLN